MELTLEINCFVKFAPIFSSFTMQHIRADATSFTGLLRRSLEPVLLTSFYRIFGNVYQICSTLADYEDLSKGLEPIRNSEIF